MLTSGHPVYFKDDYYLPENFLELDGVNEVTENTNYIYHLIFDTHEVIYSNGLTKYKIHIYLQIQLVIIWH